MPHRRITEKVLLKHGFGKVDDTTFVLDNLKVELYSKEESVFMVRNGKGEWENDRPLNKIKYKIQLIDFLQRHGKLPINPE